MPTAITGVVTCLRNTPKACQHRGRWLSSSDTTGKKTKGFYPVRDNSTSGLLRRSDSLYDLSGIVTLGDRVPVVSLRSTTGYSALKPPA